MAIKLAVIKGLVVSNLGSPQNNQNAATALAGTEFEAGQLGKEVIGVVLPALSPRGKVQAELTCIEPGCTEKHTREMSDWHQCSRCRTHGNTAGKKLTAEEKALRALARAEAMLKAARGE